MMSGKQFFILFLLLAGTHAAIEIFTPRLMPPKWEYRTYYLKASDDDGLYYGAGLKKLGKDGWELVEVLPSGPYEHICYLKRPTLRGKSSKDDD